MRPVFLVLAALACGGDKAEDTSPSTTPPGKPEGACGAVTEGYAVVVRGRVTLQGEPVAGASVTVRERLWNAGKVHGVGETDAEGLFSIDTTELVSVEDCWGTALDYEAEAVWDSWSASRDLNAPLYGAILDDGEADLTGNPIELDPDWRPPLDTGR